MAVLHTISQLSFLILLFGAYLTVARPTCQTVTTQMIHVKRLQTTMELTRNLLNETLSCNQSVSDCIAETTEFLCSLTVLHLFTNESSSVSSEYHYSCACTYYFTSANSIASVFTMLCMNAGNGCLFLQPEAEQFEGIFQNVTTEVSSLIRTINCT